MANTMVQVVTLYCITFVSYSRFCKHLSFIFPILDVQIDLSVVKKLLAHKAETWPEHIL